MRISDWSSDVCSSDLRIKIEFQGGEPTLRLDLFAAVIERCTRFAERQFVVCTNLQSLSDAHLALFDRDDVYISTSLDGDVATHTANRTATPAATKRFRTNLETVIARYGPDKVSALPTLDPLAPPDIDALIDSYARSEEHTSELQSLMRISYAVFCLHTKKNKKQ